MWWIHWDRLSTVKPQCVLICSMPSDYIIFHSHWVRKNTTIMVSMDYNLQLTVTQESWDDFIVKSLSDLYERRSHSHFSVEWPNGVHLKVVLWRIKDTTFEFTTSSHLSFLSLYFILTWLWHLWLFLTSTTGHIS